MKPFEIFRAGEHVASCGTRLEFSEQDLRASAAAYDPARRAAPIVIGHPTNDAPVRGWVAGLACAGNVLVASAHQVAPAFAEMVREGRYRKVSASFFRPNAAGNPVPGTWYLKHVGFLGAMPPAVKGLRPVELSAGDHGTVTFSDEEPVSNFPFPTDPTRTAITIAYKNRRLIADDILPRVAVARMEFSWLKHDLAEGITVPSTLVGRRGRPNEITFTATEEKGLCLDYALDDPVPAVDVQHAPEGLNPVDQATMMLTDLIMLDREIRVAGKVFSAATYPSGNKVQLSGTSQWSDYTNSDPIAALETGIERPVIRPNTLVLGRRTFDVVKRHPKMIKALYGPLSDDGFATREQIAKLFDLDTVFIGEAFMNIAKRGQAVSVAQVWGPHAALLWLDPALRSPSGSASFGFTGQYGSRVAGSDPDKSIGFRGGYRVRVGESVAEIVSCSDLGYFIQDAVAAS